MAPQNFPYRRIIVVGTTGSGKSTLAEQLAHELELDYIELDALHWLPGWQHVSDEELRRRVELATRSDAWVMAGNYGVARDISWPRAEVAIWLDYPLWTIFWRLWRRTWSRWWNQELLWGTNYERLFAQFKIWSAEDSLFHWLFKTYWRRRREYPRLFVQPEFCHLKILQFKTPEETAQWLGLLSKLLVSAQTTDQKTDPPDPRQDQHNTDLETESHLY